MPQKDNHRPDLTVQYEERRLLALARELAQEIYPVGRILEIHGVSPDDYRRLLATPWFAHLLDEQVRQWSSGMRAEERVRLKSIAMIEEALPEMNARLHDRNETLISKMKLFEILGKFAGLGRDEGSAGGPGVSISIDLGRGGDQPTVTMSAPRMIDVTPADEPEGFDDVLDEVTPEVTVAIPPPQVESLDALLSAVDAAANRDRPAAELNAEADTSHLTWGRGGGGTRQTFTLDLGPAPAADDTEGGDE